MEVAIISSKKKKNKNHETVIATGQQYRFCQHWSRGDAGNGSKQSHQQQVQHPHGSGRMRMMLFAVDVPPCLNGALGAGPVLQTPLSNGLCSLTPCLPVLLQAQLPFLSRLPLSRSSPDPTEYFRRSFSLAPWPKHLAALRPFAS